MALKFARHPARFVWRCLNLYLVGRIRRLALRGGAALHDWAGLASNPFLQRALRIEARKYKPLLTVLGAVCLVGIMIGGAWRVWPHLIDLAYGKGIVQRHVWRGRAVRASSPFAFLVTAVGGSFVSCVALLTATACAYISITASRARAAYLLRQELFKGTLDQLQLLPIREERWLWMMSAHPTALTLLLWLTGLPIYCLAVLTGQWSLRDIFGLLLVFVMLGHVLPLWQPMQWKQKNPKGKAQKFDPKAWRETLKRARGELDPSQLPLGQMTVAQRLEMQRRTQRAMGRVDEIATANAAADTDAATGGAPADKQRHASRASFGGGSGSGGGGQFGSSLGWIGALFFLLNALSGFRGGFGPFGVLWHNLPPDAAILLPAFPLSWPLLLARMLTEPISFFAFALPPGVLILPLWVGFLQQRCTALAANVSSLETFWIPRRVRKRKAIGAAVLLGLLLLSFGYGWELLIVNGLLALFLRPAPLTTPYALAAGWTLCLVIATIISSRLADAPFKRFHNDELSFPRACQTAFILILRPLAYAIAVYFVFCWMGRLSGLDGVWLARLEPTLATVFAFVLALFGSASLQAAHHATGRGVVRVVRFVWFPGLALLVMALTISDARLNLGFSFEQAPVVLLSPWVTLLSLFRVELTHPTALWWWGPLAQALLGTVCLLLAVAQHARGVAPIVAPAPLEVAPDTPLSRWQRLVAWLRRVMAAILGWVERLNETFHHWDDWLIERGRRYDNAVLTAELRRRVTREYWLMQLIVFFLMGAAGFVFIADPTALVGLPLTNAWLPPIDYVVWGQSVVLSVLGVSLMTVIISSLNLGQSFDRERSNGTLLFLFLTPMTDAAILRGKLMPSLAHGALLLSTALPWLLCGSLAGMAGGSLVPLILTILGLLFILAVWLCSVCFQLAGATYASKPGEGAGLAILAGVGLEGLLLAAAAFIDARWYDYSNGASDNTLLTVYLAFVALAHFALTYGAWRLALWLLRRQRYGDVLEKSPRLLAWILGRVTKVRMASE